MAAFGCPPRADDYEIKFPLHTVLDFAQRAVFLLGDLDGCGSTREEFPNGPRLTRLYFFAFVAKILLISGLRPSANQLAASASSASDSPTLVLASSRNCFCASPTALL